MPKYHDHRKSFQRDVPMAFYVDDQENILVPEEDSKIMSEDDKKCFTISRQIPKI